MQHLVVLLSRSHDRAESYYQGRFENDSLFQTPMIIQEQEVMQHLVVLLSQSYEKAKSVYAKKV